MRKQAMIIITVLFMSLSFQNTVYSQSSDKNVLENVLITTLHSEIKNALKDYYHLKDPRAVVQFQCVDIENVKQIKLHGTESLSSGYEYEIKVGLQARIDGKTDAVTIFFSNKRDAGEQFNVEKINSKHTENDQTCS